MFGEPIAMELGLIPRLHERISELEAELENTQMALANSRMEYGELEEQNARMLNRLADYAAIHHTWCQQMGRSLRELGDAISRGPSISL